MSCNYYFFQFVFNYLTFCEVIFPMQKILNFNLSNLLSFLFMALLSPLKLFLKIAPHFFAYFHGFIFNQALSALSISILTL